MPTNWSDIHDQGEHDRSRPRDRSWETSEFIARCVQRWLIDHGATVVRTHPQEFLAGHTPIGLGVRTQ